MCCNFGAVVIVAAVYKRAVVEEAVAKQVP
jgi:hypothetical protein